jgi:L-ornithine N5-oxygenase
MISRGLSENGGSRRCDVLGVGFGPSNLAFAIALDEHNTQLSPDRALVGHYLERQPRFGWHRGMLIDGPLMQVPFLKDLATLRNPASRFSFVTYLKSKGRLNDFINHKCWFPSRVEFNDYLEWAASAFDRVVDYGSDVIAIRPIWEDGVVTCFEVVVERGGAVRSTGGYRARNLVVALGLEPCLPDGTVASKRIWHNCELVHRVSQMSGEAPRRIVVIGAGQSAAETTEYLYRSFPAAEVCALSSHYGYRLIDDSPYVNRIFDPEAVDVFYGSPEQVKSALLAQYGNTSYSVVDIGLIHALYDRAYQESVVGVPRLRMLDLSRVLEAREIGAGVSLRVECLATGEISNLDADVLVYATGYRSVDPSALLGELHDYCEYREGQLTIGRNYRVATAPEIRAGIYLQGPTESSHGISSSLLSNIAVRAGEIVDAIAEPPSPTHRQPRIEQLTRDCAM